MRSVGVMVGIGCLAAWVALAQNRSSGAASPPAGAAAPPAVATVGALRISKSEFEERFAQATRGYRARAGADLPAEYRPQIRRQLLESLVRQRLVILEARRRGMLASVEEAEAQLKRDPAFNENGVFNESKYLAIKAGQAPLFNNAIQELRATLPARRLSETIDRESRPDESEIRARVVRRLSEVTLDFLALRKLDFDGNGPEPTEAELLAYYRTHGSEHQRPEEVRLSLVQVNYPPMTVDDAGDDARMKAWEDRMKQRADSALAALRQGARLEDIGRLFGGVKKDVVVHRGEFPAYWHGSQRAGDAVFSLAPGQVLPEPVAGTPGWIVARVDQHAHAGPAPLVTVATEMRAKLRTEKRKEWEEQHLRGLYNSVRDSLRGSAYRIRYAVADTAATRVGEPTAADLDRFYRGHMADYSSFDAASGTVVAKPFAQVRDEVRRRLLTERREAAVRNASERLFAAWSDGKRDAAAERAMSFLREVGPIPAGAPVDTGAAGKVITDSLASRWGEVGVGIATYPRGVIVYNVFGEVKDYLPTFEQARAELLRRTGPERDRDEESGARALYEKDPEAFRVGRTAHFARLIVQPPTVLDITLSRSEVERWYRSNIANYSAPELCRARHILISPKKPGSEGEREARAKAVDLIKRIKAGEDFATLARQNSDDAATKNAGGDVGIFRRGMMLDEFERVAFQMRPGQISDPVKSEVGFHVIQCTEYVPSEVTPLRYAYSNVGFDLATLKADSIAQARAESLLKVIHTPSQGRAVAAKTGLMLIQNEHVIGERVNASELVKYFKRIENTKPGDMVPGVQHYKGLGYVVSWVDSVSGSHLPTWAEARQAALDRYRREGNVRALNAKRAELDSLARAGWSFDSLGTLFGGLETLGPSGPGAVLPRLAGKSLLDSLSFGTARRGPVLERGKPTDWIEFPAGFARVRLLERFDPDPVELANRMESERRIATERNLQATFDKLKQRYPVRILDPELRATSLPPLPADS